VVLIPEPGVILIPELGAEQEVELEPELVVSAVAPEVTQLLTSMSRKIRW